MKIALIHRYYPAQGGITTVVDSILKGLPKEHEVEIITNQNTKKEGVKIIHGKGPLFYINLLRYIKKKNFDIIHTHSFPFCYLAPFVKPPVVFSSHGFDVTYNEGLAIRIRNVFRSIPRTLSYIWPKKIIAVSNLVKKKLNKEYWVPINKIDIIHNSVDINRFRPAKKTVNNKVVRVFLYGSDYRKGFYFILKEAPKIIKEIKNIKFLVVGPKREVPKDLQKHFEFKNHIPYDEMSLEYQKSDIVIMPSMWDPFGITGLEGMACGKPTIVSKNSGVMEIIENNKDGIVSDLKNFHKEIIKLAKDKNKRKEMGKRARLKSLDNSIEEIGKKHLWLYEEVISEK